jgi:hypothetical protein
MACLKQWLVVLTVGGTLLIGLTSCVVVPVDPVPSGYAVSPPVVVIRPYHHHRHYHPYRYYRPYRPYGGWHRHPHGW